MVVENITWPDLKVLLETFGQQYTKEVCDVLVESVKLQNEALRNKLYSGNPHTRCSCGSVSNGSEASVGKSYDTDIVDTDNNRLDRDNYRSSRVLVKEPVEEVSVAVVSGKTKRRREARQRARQRRRDGKTDIVELERDLQFKEKLNTALKLDIEIAKKEQTLHNLSLQNELSPLYNDVKRAELMRRLQSSSPDTKERPEIKRQFARRTTSSITEFVESPLSCTKVDSTSHGLVWDSEIGLWVTPGKYNAGRVKRLHET
jgi:DNA repair exonuclease SbcCD nuclease subunit